MFEIEEVPSSAVRIKVIGVGGAGGNAVDHMIDAGIQGVEFIVINTDTQALNQKKAPVKIAIGAELTGGKGAGADPEIGRRAAMESQEAIAEALRGADMVFVAAGMGKGTGTGAAPVVAEISRSLGILTLPVVTRPFSTEGVMRSQTAEAGLAALAQVSESVLVIPNDCLMKLAGKTSITKAFQLADNTLCHAVQSVAEVIQSTGQVNCDFNDVRAIMGLQGGVYVGVGSASGEGCALRASQQALANPYLEGVNIQGAKGILAHITYKSEEEELNIDDLGNILKSITSLADSKVNLIYGLTHNPEQVEEVRITVVASGFKKKACGETASPLLGGDFTDLAKGSLAGKRQKTQAWGETLFSSEDLDVPTFIRRRLAETQETAEVA
jgi:cell division protein FtsZ